MKKSAEYRYYSLFLLDAETIDYINLNSVL